MASFDNRCPSCGIVHASQAPHQTYLRTLIDTVPAVILAQDAEGRIRMANRITAEILGKDTDSIIGKLHREVSPETADVEELQAQIDEVIGTGRENVVERSITHPQSGEKRWFRTRVVPLRPPDGSSAHALVVATDITDHRLTEDALKMAQQETLQRLARAAEYRDDDTGQHTRRVGLLSGELARLLGRDEAEVELIREAAPLHDLGKIGIPDSILLKPTRLTAEEFHIMKSHTLIGAALLAGGDSDVMQLAEEIALSHHERWDGSGYPNEIRDEAISMAARVVAVADVVDALSYHRAYRGAWPLSQVISKVREGQSKHFDPRVAEACLDFLSADGLSRIWEESSSDPIAGFPAPLVRRDLIQ